MFPVLYLLIISLFGIVLTEYLVPDIGRFFVASASSRKITEKLPPELFYIPAGITVGIMTTTTFLYYVTSGLSKILKGRDEVYRTSILLTSLICIALILTFGSRIYKQKAPVGSGKKFSILSDYKYKTSDLFIYGLVVIAVTGLATFLMFYTYRIDGNELKSGYSTFSDFGPHTAMISSFGKGFNFPTQYMHFPGDGIQYHFFFFFLCGILEYMGMPIDYAVNIPSIVTMVCALTLLGVLAVLISNRKAAFGLAPLFVFFRSSYNVFHFIKTQQESGVELKDAIKMVFESSSWYEVTPYDSWGIWAINVYPNQRHFMLGMSMILLITLLFLPCLRRMFIALRNSASFAEGFKHMFFSRDAWLPKKDDPLKLPYLTLIAVLVVITAPYFHGSALITALLVLFGLAVFSEARLMHLIVAVTAVASSFIQTNIFSGGAGNVVKMEFITGFIFDGQPVGDILKAVLSITGTTVVIAILTTVLYLIFDIKKSRPVYRAFLFIACMLPFIFAFCVKVSLEMLANHKFIQFSMILICAFVASFFANLFHIPLRKRQQVPEGELDEDYAIETIAAVKTAEEEKDPEEEAKSLAAAAEALRAASVEIENETGEAPVVEESLKEIIDAEKDKKPEKKNKNKKGKKKAAKAPQIRYVTVGIDPKLWLGLQIAAIIFGILLIIPECGTGVFEWCTYYNLNKGSSVAQIDSPLAKWVEKNTDYDDVFLTPTWSFNRFTLAGRPMYYGWPYYAWSAGHDTGTRSTIYEWLCSGCDGNADEFVRYAKERNIRYVVADRDFYSQQFDNGIGFNGDFFEENFARVAEFPDDNDTVVYKVW